MNQSFYFADTYSLTDIYILNSVLSIFDAVCKCDDEALADCSRSDVRTKRCAARSDPAPASGYLTPHPDLQNKILSTFYANMVLAAAAASRRGLWEVLCFFPSCLLLKL